MANWKVEKPLDSTDAQLNDVGPKFLKCTGAGTDADPYVIVISSGISDGTNTITLTSAAADGESNTRVAVPVSAFPRGFNGTTWDRLRAGILGAVSTVAGYLNVITVGRYNATPPTLTDGQWINPQCDVNGNLQVNGGYLGGVPNQGTVTVLSASPTLILPANADRKGVLLQDQDASNPIFVSFTPAVTAAVGGTCFRIAAGGDKEFGAVYSPQGAIWAIASGGNAIVHYTEYV